MATSPFVLTPVGVDWEGSTGKQVTVSVAPSDSSIVLQTAEYPRGTPLTISGGKAQFKVISGGPNVLAVTIRTVVPSVSWQLVEVGSPAGLQVLDTVDSTDPVPYYTSVYIKGT
jgi:hypothetical protein